MAYFCILLGDMYKILYVCINKKDVNMYKSIKECIKNGQGFRISPKDFRLNTMATYQARLTKDLGRKITLTYNGEYVSEVAPALDTSVLTECQDKVRSGLDLSIQDRGEIFSCLRDIKDVAYELGFVISIDTKEEEI